MDVIPPHFTVSTAFFCPCFFHQFLKSLQEKGSCSVQILRSVMREKCISSSIEVFERLVYLYFVFRSFASGIGPDNTPIICVHYRRRTFAGFEIERGDYEILILLCLFVLKNIHFVFWNISQGSCPLKFRKELTGGFHLVQVWLWVI